MCIVYKYLHFTQGVVLVVISSNHVSLDLMIAGTEPGILDRRVLSITPRQLESAASEMPCGRLSQTNRYLEANEMRSYRQCNVRSRERWSQCQQFVVFDICRGTIVMVRVSYSVQKVPLMAGFLLAAVTDAGARRFEFAGSWSATGGLPSADDRVKYMSSHATA